MYDPPLLDENDPCINYHIYDRYAKKIIPYNRKAIETVKDGYIEDVDILHEIQLILNESNSSNNNLKQTLVYTSLYDQSSSEMIYQNLDRLQNKKGWDIIIVCFVSVKNCPIESYFSAG